MDTTLIKMTERFEALKQFREQQTRKASIRYVGHPEYKAPELQQEAAAGKEPGAGLAPIRTKISTSRAVTPDGTPRGNGDTAGADGDISNSNTPHDFFSSHYYRDLPIRPGSHDTPEPHTPNNLPSPYVSTPGDMSPGGISTSTGAIQTPIHSERDAGFRLPANYAELVRKARLQRGLDRVQPSGWTPLASPWGSIRASPSRESMMRWNAGLPSEEGLRDLHEVSSFYHIDRAIYDHEGRKHHAPIESQFDAARPPSNKDPSSGSLSSSSSKRKASSDDPIMQSARSSRSGIVEEHALQDRTSTNLDPSTPSHTQEADANMKPPASPDIVPASQSSNPQRSVEALQLDAAEPAKKRNRPHPIQTFLQTSSNLFRFPTPKLSPISPGMDGFKPSLHVEMAASPELSPGRQTVKNAVQSLKDRMRHLSTLSSPGSTIEAFKAQRREDHRSDRLSFDPTDGPVVSAP
ncbi:hypothetical protein EX895_004105 [Sporisorium graminicola]|uniref:Uncharacterized protein n=1 Tax=Sporisorium graminicola TaxID=280036 RepID=A0A4U7KTP2_9BASI|nr:hypothetical protein EX895_004105 [Sporisorium graminicola]TKY87427.1 hypothetical protein EX895_004105 [Sporisorium graminicola]